MQSHPKARLFKKKNFPLFDDIAILCGDTIATGAGAFRPAWSDIDGVGDDDEDPEPEEGVDDEWDGDNTEPDVRLSPLGGIMTL